MSSRLAVITAGPASAPIDGVRRITNHATGEIGHLLAGALAARGFECTLFLGHGAIPAAALPGVRIRAFLTNRDLADELRALAGRRGGEVRCVFHAAALADYRVSAVSGPEGALPQGGKLPGNLERLTVTLEPAEKILPALRGWFPCALVTAWKYELEGSRDTAVAAARRQLLTGRADLSVVNGTAYGPGFGLLEGEQSPVEFADKRELAVFLASRAAESRDCHG